MSLIIEFVKEFYELLCMMAPYLLFGFVMSGVVSLFVSPEKIRKHLGGNSFVHVIKAALFGVPLPLCSCSVIPVAAGLKRSGAGNGAVCAFLISTPQTGVDSFVVTGSFLGWFFAAVRVVLAFISGVLGGAITNKAIPFETTLGNGLTDDGPSAEKSCGHCCSCQSSAGKQASEKWTQRIIGVFRYSFGTLFDDMAGSLAVGLFVAALIGFFVPSDFFTGYFTRQWQVFLLMLVIGLPLYVCSTASVAVAASLLAKGVSPGGVLIFLIVGPAANGATLGAVWKLLGSRGIAVYLGVLSVMAVSAGYLIDWARIPMAVRFPGSAGHSDGFFSHLCAWVFIVLVVRSCVLKWVRRYYSRAAR